MANITRVGQASGSGASLALPAHQAGDVIVGFAFRDGSVTAPTLPSGWTDINSGGANLCSSRVGWKRAAGSGETSGTWTNATEVLFVVYRNARGIGNNSINGGSSSSVTYTFVNGAITDGTSWYVAAAGHVSPDVGLEAPPTGMLNLTGTTDATAETAVHDTNGPETGWGSQTVSVGGTIGGWRSHVVEILARRDLALDVDRGLYAVSGLAADTLGPRGRTAFPGPLPSVGMLLNSSFFGVLAADQGAYSVSGQQATTRKSWTALAADQGAYSVSGQAAGSLLTTRGSSGAAAFLPSLSTLMGAPRTLVADTATHSVAGQAAGLAFGKRMPAVAGTYLVIGSEALRDFEIRMEPGSHSVSGQAASLFRGFRLAQEHGFLNFAGQQTTALRRGPAPLVAEGSSVQVAGQVAGLRSGRRMAAGQGAYSETGQAAGLRRGRRLEAVSGVYLCGGNAANLVESTQQAFELTAQSGELAVAGVSARLITVRSMPAAQGAVAVSGSAAGMVVQGRRVNAEVGFYVHESLHEAVLSFGFRLPADGGAYSYFGEEANMVTSERLLAAESGTHAFDGFPANLARGSSVDPSESRTVYVEPESRLFYVEAQEETDMTDGNAITVTGSGLTAKKSTVKDPEAVLDYAFYFKDWLAEVGDSISVLTASAVNPPGVAQPLVVLSATHFDGIATVFVSGGTLNKTHSLVCRITTNSTPPRVDERTLSIKIRER